ncbi:uncharacterized protein IWZ02DRAFT_463646 [Phyllosticta citriasiana]|uniref:uncharacterized protein n=1 Tax=Phyllosticta citriasiana TaxID=595635 RepID=UPI0030FD70D1
MPPLPPLPFSSTLRASTSTRSFQIRHLLSSSSTSHAPALGLGLGLGPGPGVLFNTTTSASFSPRAATATVTSSPSRPLGTSFRRFSSSTQRAAESETTMASAAAQEQQPKCEWVVILPDKPGVLEKRVSVRDSHLAAIPTAYPSDFWLVAGALLERAPHDARNEAGVPLPMQGSAAVVWASSEEEVRRLLSGDVYACEGVWDMERLQCWAFKSAFRR